MTRLKERTGGFQGVGHAQGGVLGVTRGLNGWEVTWHD